MGTRAFSFCVGLFFIFLGVGGFIPDWCRTPFNMVPVRNTDSDWDVVQLFGCLPVTSAVNVMHLAVGAVGILAAAGIASSRTYCRVLAALMLLLVVTGTLPFGINSLWGFLPLSGGQLAMHLIAATMAFYFGFVHDFDAREAQVSGAS